MSAPRTDRVNAAAGRAPASSPAALLVAWAIVGIPAVWGVAQTVIKSLALFR